MQKTEEGILVADIIYLEKKLYRMEHNERFKTLFELFRGHVDPSFEYSKKINEEKRLEKKEAIERKLKELFNSIKNDEENLILYINSSDADIIKKLYNIDISEYTKFEISVAIPLPLLSDPTPSLLPFYSRLIYPKSPKNVDLAKQLVEKIIASLEERV